MKTISDKVVYITVTADDFCVATQSYIAYRTVISDIRRKYHAKDLGMASRIPGWSVRRPRSGGLHTSQPYLIQRVIDTVDPRGTRQAYTPYIESLDGVVEKTEHILPET